MENSYTFQITSYNTDLLLDQVSKAMELRTELLSRERYPRLWRATDRLRSASRGETRSRMRSKFMGILCLILGVFLFIPGLTNPKELIGPLLIGAFGILYGVVKLRSGRKKQENPFERSARLFLDNKGDLTEAQELEVVFDEIGVRLTNDCGDPEIIPYESFECAVKGPDLFLFTFDSRVIILQNYDLLTENSETFWAFISQKVPLNTVFS